MIPIKLTLSNFLSHQHSEIDFTKFNSALLIGNTDGDYAISNGSGKSAIFESILWVLFNKIRVSPADDLIRWGETICFVEFEFMHEGDLYKVKRIRNRMLSKMEVFLHVHDNDDWVDISGTTARLTNKEIEKRIRLNYKTFVNSIYFRQKDITEFADSDSGRRKEILKSIIDISRWDAYETKVKEELKVLEREANVLAELSMDYTEVVESLNTEKEGLAVATQELQRLTGERVNKTAALEKLSSEYQKIKSSLDTDSWDRITAENKELAEKHSTKIAKVKDIRLSADNYKEMLADGKSRRDSLEKELRSISIDENISVKIESLNSKLVEHSSTVSTSEKMLEVLDNKKITHGECYACGQEVGEVLYEKLLSEREVERRKYEAEKRAGEEGILSVNDGLNKAKAIQDEQDRIWKIESEIESLNASISMHSEHLSKLSVEGKGLVSDIKIIKSKIEANNKIIEALKDDSFQEVHKQLDDYKKQLAVINSDIEMSNREIGVLTEKVKSLVSTSKEKEGYIQKLMELRGDIDVLSKLRRVFGKKGIQTVLLNEVIEDLEDATNKILSSIYYEPFNVKFETQRFGADGVTVVECLELKVRKSGIQQNFCNLSGGQQYRVALAIRVALSEIASHYGGASLDFLLMDEVNASLDKHGTETLFFNVIKALEEKYKIIVTTHDDSLKEKFENILDVSMSNGASRTDFYMR